MAGKYVPPHLRPGFQPPIPAKPVHLEEQAHGVRFRSTATGLPSSNIHMRIFNSKQPELTRTQVAMMNSHRLGSRKIRAKGRTLRSALKGSKKHTGRLTQSVGPQVRQTRKRRASF